MIEKSRWNNDLPSWIRERHYTKDEIDDMIKYDSLQSILTLSWIISSFVVDTGVSVLDYTVDEFMSEFQSWCDSNSIDVESLI